MADCCSFIDISRVFHAKHLKVHVTVDSLILSQRVSYKIFLTSAHINIHNASTQAFTLH
jgi:hypothetical protein